MYSVAVGANRDFRVAFGKQLSMDAGLILAELVCSQRGIVLTHEGGIGMAAPAEGRNLIALDLSTKPGGFAHCVHVGLGGIAAMAARTRQTLLRMDVVGELLLRYLQRRIERGVAFDAGVCGLRQANLRERQRKQQPANPKYRAISPCTHRQ